MADVPGKGERILLSKLNSILSEHPIAEYMFIECSSIPFSENLRYYCEEYCPVFNTKWCCPPNVGNISDNIAKCQSYQYAVIISIMTYDSKADFYERHDAAKRNASKVLLDISKQFDEILEEPTYGLFPGCVLCKTCAYPDHPCRFPDKWRPGIESHGVLLRPLLEEYQFTRYVEKDGFSYFGMLFFNAPLLDIRPEKVSLVHLINKSPEGAVFAEYQRECGLCSDFNAYSPLPAGHYAYNGADLYSPCVITTNYPATSALISNELEHSDQPVNLIIIDTDQHPVILSWAEDKLTAEIIKDHLSLYHRQGGTLIIPGILRHITEDLGQLLPNWKIVVSDRECNTLLDYI